MIFISHADEDRQLARRLCEALEKGGVKCWIAPRDVTPGKSYAVEIMRGIEKSDAVVLLLSQHANASSMVEREIERAVNKNRTIIPLRILGTVAAGALEFLVATKHWIDAGDAPVEQFVDQILGAIPSAQNLQRAKPEGTARGLQERDARDQEQRAKREAEEIDLEQGKGPRKVPIDWRRAALVPTLLLFGCLVVLVLISVWRVQEPPPAATEKEPQATAAAEGQARLREEPRRTPEQKAALEVNEARWPTPRVAAIGAMVNVPAGAFRMGCNEKVDKHCLTDELPGRTVKVDAFSIDRTEVTVAQYRQCMTGGPCTKPARGGQCNWEYWSGESRDEHPINCVDWIQAATYCEWAGKRLPSEAEWEKAARGTDARTYPWGDEWSADKANVSTESTTPVGYFPAGASPYGALDMSGNVWEWVSDKVGNGYGVRGGSWMNDELVARASYRSYSFARDERPVYSGFRCARNA